MNSSDVDNVDDSLHVVAIGASAGGLDAMTQFFRNVNPDTGAAYIVVAHLSPDYKSMLDELLSRDTTMPIKVAADGDRIKANHVYIIPPGKNMTILNQFLILTKISVVRGLNLPIDIFFQSAAEQYQHRSVGIILSGTGSDGSRGLGTIKEAGGLTLVQNPESAQYDGMPVSSITRVSPDFILPPNEIAEYLEKYLAHPFIGKREANLRQALENRGYIMGEIFKVLEARYEIDFSLYRPTTLTRRIERRMGIRQTYEIQDYLELLQTDVNEVESLYQDLLIGVTQFFRNSDAFDLLSEQVVDKIILSADPKQEIRIWDVACSSGEETYSLAILFADAMQKNKTKLDVKIYATDIDPSAIKTASIGRYKKEIVEEIKPEWASKYFTFKGNEYTVANEIRRMVVFAVHDITKDPAFSNIDLAVCRNVLIYFQHSVQKRIISTLHYALRRPGYLFLGQSETLADLAPYFRVLSEKHRIFENVCELRVPLGMPAPGQVTRQRLPPVANLVRNHRVYNHNDLIHDINRHLITQYLPVTIILDLNYNVEYIYGEAGNYLNKPKAGRFTTNILELLSDALRLPVSTALHRVEKDNKPFSFTDVRYKEDEKDIYLTIEAAPYFQADTDQPFNFILFFHVQSEAPVAISKEEKAADGEVQKYDETSIPYKRIRELEEEVLRITNHLNVTIEELETTNEELQASNEELLVSNEELHSTNEEMQAMNEELYSLNAEYQQKIIELSELNTDMQHFMQSTEIGMIFLDHDYKIRKFTPNSKLFVPLVDSDVGRYFFDFANKITYDGIHDDFETVLNSKITIEKNAVLEDPLTNYLIRILPYLDQSNQCKGLVVTFTDVTSFVSTQKKLSRAVELLINSMEMHLSADNSRNYRVAVLDDNEVDCTQIQRLLMSQTSDRYEVDLFTEHAKLMAALKENQYDVLLLDYYLNGIDALELLEQHNEVFRLVPTILLSGIDYVVDKTTEFDKFNVYDIVPKDHLSTALLERSIRYAYRMGEVNRFTAGPIQTTH